MAEAASFSLLLGTTVASETESPTPPPSLIHEADTIPWIPVTQRVPSPWDSRKQG